MSKQNIKAILVNLDCLLDTRQGALLTISPDLALDVTSKPGYCERSIDRFEYSSGHITKETLNQVRDAKPAVVLRNSIRTRMTEFLLELIMRYQIQASTTPWFSVLEVHINVAPFDFNEEERMALLQAIDALLQGSTTTLKVVSITDAQLTAARVKDDYVAMIRYDWVDWLNQHTQGIIRNPLKDVAMFVPRLQIRGDLKQVAAHDLKQIEERAGGPFELLSKILSPLLGLQFLEPRLFCGVSPLNLPHDRGQNASTAPPGA